MLITRKAGLYGLHRKITFEEKLKLVLVTNSAYFRLSNVSKFINIEVYELENKNILNMFEDILLQHKSL
ncbi:hypothetical protein LG21E20_14020 [Lactococcus formosensis]|nr:hypothetical protein NALG_1767 [Lactococcus formosensis]BDW49740.1 hypothetical protein LG21E20_14020 [Lactococcus formosensis]BDX25328.1 hypothetical protein LFMS200408A_14050 [Lactococcus formosensis]